MIKRSGRQKIYVAAALVLTLIAVVLRLAALFLDFNPQTNYFDSKVLINIASAVLATGSVFLFTYAFFAESKKPLVATFTSPANLVPTTLICVALMYFAAGIISRLKAYGVPMMEAIAAKNVMYIIYLALLVLSVLSIVYFIENALIEKRSSVSRAAFGIIAILFLALYATHFFFNTELQLNAPNKIVDQLAYLFAALFFLYEIRISLGRECWNLYVAFGLISSSLLAYSSIPSLIYYFAKEISISAGIYETALSLSLFIFIMARMIISVTLGEDRVSDTVTLIKDSFAKRNEYIREVEAEEKRILAEAERQKREEAERLRREEEAKLAAADASYGAADDNAVADTVADADGDLPTEPSDADGEAVAAGDAPSPKVPDGNADTPDESDSSERIDE